VKIKAQEISDLYVEYREKVLGKVCKKVSNRNDAEDVAMNIWCNFVKLCNAGEVQHKKALTTILYTMTERAIVDHYRSKEKDHKIMESAKSEAERKEKR
jgi:DNA-directed RNA polymerase specialized sigma24 family protein